MPVLRGQLPALVLIAHPLSRSSLHIRAICFGVVQALFVNHAALMVPSLFSTPPAINTRNTMSAQFFRTSW